MNKNIAPIAEVQPITSEQIGRASDRFQTRCRKHAVSLPKKIVQEVLEHEGDVLSQEMFEVFRNRVERRSEMIVRHVKVDRTRTREEMIKALGRKEYIDKGVLATMPTEGKNEEDVLFFPGKRFIPVAKLALEYELRGLVPDPYAQAQVNIDDPAFADEHPNGTQWKDAQGNLCFVTFDRWDEERYVSVLRDDAGWYDNWWFGGVRKIIPQT